MTLRRPLFWDRTSPEVIPSEMSPTQDEIALGKITLGGVGGTGLDAGGQIVTNLPAPVNTSDAATKGYVDAVGQGINVKNAVRALATTNIATLSGTMTIDGVALVAGARVLLAGQTSAIQNGIWIVQSTAWTRAPDLNTGAAAGGTFTFVEMGTTYAEQGWVCTSDVGSDIVGTNPLGYTQFTGLGEVGAGNGLTKSNNLLAVALANNPGLQFTGAALDLLLKSGGGLQKDASGLSLLLNANTTLAADTNGLRVLGLPSLFTIANSAVDANVTAAALCALCDGSSSVADSYHTHNYVKGAKLLQDVLQNGPTAGNAGDPVCWSSVNSTLAKGDASTEASCRVMGVWSSATAANATGNVIRHGVAPGVLSGATAGVPYFLAAGGGLTATAPTGAGQYIVRVGYAVNATDLEVNILYRGRNGLA